MNQVQEDFRSRAAEVKLYFRFLRTFDMKGVLFASSDEKSAFSSLDQSELFKTLKANGFLLLYNLVESTSKNAIERIYEELKARGTSFDACSDNVKRIILRNLKNHDVEKIQSKLSVISTDIIISTFRKDQLFGGNVDARQLKKVAENYGFQHPHIKSEGLLTIKSHRNDLAHGTKSFSDVGRDYSIEQLEEILQEVVDFLELLLRNVAEYLDNRNYLTHAT